MLENEEKHIGTYSRVGRNKNTYNSAEKVSFMNSLKSGLDCHASMYNIYLFLNIVSVDIREIRKILANFITTEPTVRKFCRFRDTSMSGIIVKM